MLTPLAQTIVGRDTITLYQTDTVMSGNTDAAPYDGYRDRYVFDVKGPRLSGMGAVYANTSWFIGGDQRYGARRLDAWQPGATPRVDVNVAAHTLASDLPDGDQAVTLNGVTYRHGMLWHGDRLERSSVNRNHDYGRISDAASDRLSTVFGAVREMFLALPDAERATIARSLENERAKARNVRDEAEARQANLTRAIAELY